MATETIPVIDLGPYLAGEKGALYRTAKELRFALTEIGFYFIVNHGVPREKIRATFDQVKRFHAQPLEKKLALKIDQHLPDAHFELAELLAAVQDNEGSLKEYHAALAVDPYDAKSECRLGQSALRASDTETAAKHFSHLTDLVLVMVDVDRLGPSLEWEPSRVGALFPHLYAPLDTSAAIAVTELPDDEARAALVDGLPDR